MVKIYEAPGYEKPKVSKSKLTEVKISTPDYVLFHLFICPSVASMTTEDLLAATLLLQKDPNNAANVIMALCSVKELQKRGVVPEQLFKFLALTKEGDKGQLVVDPDPHAKWPCLVLIALTVLYFDICLDSDMSGGKWVPRFAFGYQLLSMLEFLWDACGCDEENLSGAVDFTGSPNLPGPAKVFKMMNKNEDLQTWSQACLPEWIDRPRGGPFEGGRR